MLQGRLDADAALGIEYLIGDAVGGKRLHVLCRSVELGLRAEELQGALHALVIGDAGLLAQRDERSWLY